MECMLEDTSYDVIVVGTGPVQSVVAAALARIGKKVLHLDPNGYYGGCYGTLQLPDFIACVDPSAEIPHHDPFAAGAGAAQAATAQPDPADHPVPLRLSSKDIVLPGGKSTIHIPRAPACSSPSCRQSLGKRACYSPSCPFVVKKGPRARVRIAEDAPVHTWVDVTARTRMYNFDFIPKICYSRSETVQLLISSNIGRYLDFKIINNTFMFTNNELQEVPCSKQTLLLNKNISPKDKRLLVKFLQFCSSYDEASPEYQETKDKPFHETMEQTYKLNESLQQFIVNAMAFTARSVPSSEGFAAVRKYLGSLGVYGATSFLYPVYGAGELPQAFCRLSAVYGGVYVLRSSVSHLLFSADGATCTGVFAGGQKLTAKHVVVPSHILAERSAEDGAVFRCAALVEGAPAGLASGSHLLSFPEGIAGNPKPVKAFVFGSEVSATPRNQYLIQLLADGSSGAPEADLKPVLDALLAMKGSTPRLLWSSYFAVRVVPAQLPAHLAASSGSLIPCRDVDNAAVGYDELVTEAEQVFRQICPGEEYLPSAPNPEDIVWGSDEPAPLPEPCVTSFGTRYYSLDAYEEGEGGILALPDGCLSLAANTDPATSEHAAAPAEDKEVPSTSVVLPEAGGDSTA